MSYNLPSGYFNDDFHKFSIEWDPGVISWYVDDVLYETRTYTEWYSSGTSKSTNPFAPFDTNFYLQLNVAVGGPNTGYTGKQSPDDSVFPQYMYVDYVRVYSRTGGVVTPTPVPVTTATPTPTPLPPPVGSSLLSQGKTATASSVQTTNVATNGNDGDSTTTRWTAIDGTYPQWWKVDLGANKNLTRVDINWFSSSNRAYKYKIEVSNDDSTYTTVIDKTSNNTYGDTFDSVTASGKYVRITITGCTATAYASFYECKVYGN